MQVLYLGRAPRKKETMPDSLKWRRVTRHPLVFRGLTGSQRTPGFGASHQQTIYTIILKTPCDHWIRVPRILKPFKINYDKKNPENGEQKK